MSDKTVEHTGTDDAKIWLGPNGVLPPDEAFATREGGPLGHPVGEAVQTDAGCSYQVHQRGVVFTSRMYGEITTGQAILDKWLSLSPDLRRYVGPPVSIGTNAVYFERGVIVEFDGPPRLVQGEIFGRYMAHSAVDGWLGAPLGDEEAAPGGGRQSRFENGFILWRSDAGAHAITGAIHARWVELGAGAGLLGYPVTDELPVLGGGGDAGRFSRFTGGVIYWSPATGAWEVYGAIRQAWEDDHGGALGALGFPISGELGTPASGGRYNNFERGVLVWHGGGPFAGVRAFLSLNVYLDRVGTTGGEGGFDAEQDLFLRIDVSASTGESFQGRLPEGPDTDFGPDQEINRRLISVPVARGDLAIEVRIEGWDRDWSILPPDSEPDLLGTVGGHYTIDNLWGTTEAPERWSGPFMAAYQIQAPDVVAPGRFRQQGFWSFGNFSTPVLSEHQYAETFSDIGENEGFRLEGPLNRAYYDLFYRGIAAGGNCFGMVVESIHAQCGRSVFAQPISRFADDALSRNEINLKQGYQLGTPVIAYVVARFLASGLQDPVRAFLDSQSMHARGEYPAITLSNNDLFGPAHAVRPYAWDTRDPARWVMLVADPNKPAPRVPDDRDIANCIAVFPRENRFEFVFQPGDVWTGGAIYPVPSSTFTEQPSTPVGDMFSLIRNLSLLQVGNAGRTVQISDHDGRTLFDPDLKAPPGRWSDLRRDDGRVAGVTPVPLVTTAPRTPELYAVHGGTATLSHEVTSPAGQSCLWALHSPALSSLVETTGGATADALRLEYVAGAVQALVVQVGDDTVKPLSVAVAGPTGAAGARQFGLSTVLAKGHGLKLGLRDAGKELVLENLGPDLTFNLDLQAASEKVSRPPVTLAAGKAARIAPADWRPEALAGAPMTMKVLDHPDGPVTGEIPV